MAAFVDRLLLKQSADTPSVLRTDLADGGINSILLGEIVVGTNPSSPALYIKNNNGGIVRLPGYRPAGDLYWNNVALLINAETGNFDKSVNNASAAVSVTPYISSFSRHGDFSYFFSGIGNTFIQLGYNNSTTSLQNIFTAECWVYFTNLSQSRGIFVHEFFGSNPSLQVFFNSTSNRIAATIRTSAGTFTATSASAPIVNTWVHVAVVRNDTTLTVFLNGVPGTVVSVSGNFTAGEYWALGTDGIYITPRTFLNGYLDDFRYTRGIARYKIPFTPSQYPAGTEYGDQDLIYLDALADVAISNPTVGQTLVFNGTNWVNGSPIAASLNDLPDVAITSLTTGDYLIYNGANWVNTQPVSNWFIPGDGGDFDLGSVSVEGNYVLNGGLFT